MNKLVIFLDLDGCLKTEHDDVGPFEVPSITVQSGSKTYVFAQRPHLHELLNTASQKAELILTTAAGGGYARKVLSAMNIRDFFSRIIAAEDFKNCYNFRYGYKYILVDNNHELAELKFNRLKGATMSQPEQYIWIVDTYHGSKDDKTLLELKEEIEKL